MLICPTPPLYLTELIKFSSLSVEYYPKSILSVEYYPKSILTMSVTTTEAPKKRVIWNAKTASFESKPTIV
jgi:hypothetical protein